MALRRRSKSTDEFALIRRTLSNGSAVSSEHHVFSSTRVSTLALQRQDSEEDAPFSIETCASDDTLDGEGPRSPPASPSVITITRPCLRDRSRSCLPMFKNIFHQFETTLHEFKYRIKRAFKHSLPLAFLSHICFLIGSILYLKLALVDLAWAQYARHNHVSVDVEEDDDSADSADEPSPLSEWQDPGVEAMREAHDVQSQWLYTAGALFFTCVGLLDWLRYADALYILMVLAGVTGILTGLSDEKDREMAWDCLSNHLYLIEGYTLVRGNKKKKRKNQRHTYLRLGDLCFLLGCILDVVESDCDIAGLEGSWKNCLDVAAQLLWLVCALIDLGAEIYWACE